MLPDRVSNPGPLTYESGALPIALRGPAYCILVDSSTEYVGQVHLSFRGVRSVLSLLFYFWWKRLLAYTVDPDQMPHYVASDLGLHCLPTTLLWVSR